jgi:hypothetical protein
MTRPGVPGEANPLRAALLAGFFLLVAVVGVYHHEMWRDEWQAWMLARDSASLLALLGHLRFEGHPPGWYLLLFFLSRFTRDPLAMQLLQVVLATASVYLLARFAPLPWTQKVLLAFGYFLAYEYAVIARPYALGVLAFFSFCALYPTRRRHPLLVFLALLFLAATSVYGLILSMAAVVVLLAEAATSAAEDHSNWVGRRAARIGLLGWALFCVMAALWVIPPDGMGSIPGYAAPSFSKWSLATTASILTQAYLPFPDPSAAHMWSSHFLDDGSRAGLGLSLLLACALGCGSLLLFLRRPAVAFLWVTGTGGLLLFRHLVFPGFLRHHGHLFLLFVGCLWLASLPVREWTPPAWLGSLSRTGRSWGSPFILAILSVQLVAGVILFSADFRRPFSVAQEAAEFIREQGLDHLAMAASPSPPASSIAGVLDRPIYYFGVGAPGTFVRWRRFVRPRDRNFTMERFRPVLEDAQGPVLLILGSAFEEWDADLHVEELARFPAGLAGTERFFLYRVVRQEP